jgi:hypothetical protein
VGGRPRSDAPRLTPTARALTLAIALGIITLGAGLAGAADCLDRFPAGRFGIPLSHPAVAALADPGFAPLYVLRQGLALAGADDCRYVTTGDVFRLRETPVPGALLAGCVGDFDGDGRADVALLVKRRRDGAVTPVVFLSGGPRSAVTEIDGITDPYGFAEDPSIWPGPFCIPKPPSGRFRSTVGEADVAVVGDLFTVGWRTYFWNPTAGRFEAVLTSD